MADIPPGVSIEGLNITGGETPLPSDAKRNLSFDKVKQMLRIQDDAIKRGDSLEYVITTRGFNRTSVIAKVRGFVRAKNPFEAAFVNISSVDKLDDDGFRNEYRIVASVPKR